MIKSILFDISGVLYEDNQPIKGAVEALRQLQQRTDLPCRFVTNSSRSPESVILTTLQKMGFEIEKSQLFTAVSAIKQRLTESNLRPYCLIHPDLEPEFTGFDTASPNAVVITDAAECFDYASLNQAFELLMVGAPLIGIGRNKYFKSGGKLFLDAGPFIVALEYATGGKAEILGKPAAEFFMAAVHSVACKPEEVLMIGDDVEADVNGALEAGLQACLVETGKYRSGDEEKMALSKGRFSPSVVEAIAPFVSVV